MTTKRRSKRIKRRTIKRGGRPPRPVMKPLGPKPIHIHAWGDSASKHGGDGSLNDHIVNYVKEFHASEPDQTKLDNHKQLYKNAYIRHYKIKPKRSGVLGFFKKEHPDVEKSFNKRVANEKIRVKEEQEFQEEIVRRNLKKDEVNRAHRETAQKLLGQDKEKKRKYGDMISIKKEQRRAKKNGELFIDFKNMPSTEARRFVESGRRSSTRGPSKLRGGNRRSRKYKRTRRRRKQHVGKGIGKSKPIKTPTPPKQTRKSVHFSPSTKSPSSPKNKTKKMFISKNKHKQKAVVQYENRQQRQDLLDMSLGRIPLDGGNSVRRNKRGRKSKKSKRH